MKRTITLLADDWRCREEFLAGLDLPLYSMGDFTVLGIVVDDMAAACHTLRRAGYMVLDKRGAADILFDGPQQLPNMLDILRKATINADLRDIAETLYQG
jgi:hypothetical protein